MTTIADRPSQAPRAYTVVGTRPIRHDGYDKVTGRAKYGADIQLAGLLYGAVLRSPHAHARIKRIDTSKAEKAPGVHAVMTAADLPAKAAMPSSFMETLADPNVLSQNVMAREKALYKGHAVAAVAAVSRHVAEEALGLIEVEYEALPHVLDVRDAMKPGAPILHQDLRTKTTAQMPGDMPQTQGPTNIASYVQLKQGDVAKGFAEAEVVTEHEFDTQPVHQGYIEPHNSTASWSPDGNVTIWKSTQGPFIVRHQVACILNIPASNVRVVPMEIGGGFGGKINTYTDPIAVVLSKKSGHPVKIVMSRKEVFEGTGPAAATRMRVKIGAKKDGRITAAQVWLAYAAGAFPGSPVGSGAGTCLAPYKAENLFIEGYDVVTNTPKVAAYRAPGSPQAAYAVECAIDELAQKLNMDPLDLRLKNVARTGDRQASGVPFPSIGCEQVEQAMKDHPHYKAPLTGKHQGRGVGMGYWGNAGMPSSATINVNSNGTISLITGSVDIGGQRASLAMQAAEVLGIKAEDVHPSVADTDSVGWTALTGGSRTTFATGIAVIKAAEDVRAQLMKRAAMLWETTPDQVEYEAGVLRSKKDPNMKLAFKDVAAKLMATGGPVTASASSDPKGVGPSFSAMMVDVEVDPDTGKVTILDFAIVQDAGKAVHPSYVEGQMQGGAVQGIGWALNEEYFFNDTGAMANASFLDYRMPLSLDLPMIESVLVEVPNPGHPFGVRGVGEASIVCPMAAVANAVARATGTRISRLPIAPGVIVEALKAGSTGGQPLPPR